MAVIKDTNFMKEKAEVHRKFHDLARQQFPDTGEPGAIWVLSEVLGWPMDKIERVAVEGFDRKGYRLFLLDEDDKRVRAEDGRVKTVYRNWTNEEKRKLRDWWWLLGF